MQAVSSAIADETSPRYAGWRVVLACFVAAVFCWGYGLYGHGVYLAEFHRLHGWPIAVMASATTTFYLLTSALVIFISDALNRFGPRRVMFMGACCFIAAITLLSFITSLWQLFVAYIVMAFGAASMHVGAISNVVGLWFDRRRSLALSLALNGASSGGILITPALVLAISQFGFADAMRGSAILMAVVLLPVIGLWLGRPAEPVPAKASAANASGAVATRRDALRSLPFWSVAAPLAMALTAQVGFLVHQVPLLEPLLGRGRAGLAVAILTIAAIVGRLVLGATAARLDLRRFTCWSLLSQAAALLVLAATAQPWALYLACALFGLSAGNLLTLPALIIQREFAAAAFGMLVGLSWAISQFTYSFGPGLLGVLRDLTGGYTAALALCMALEIAAAVLILLRPAPR
jgi:MFS family permease